MKREKLTQRKVKDLRKDFEYQVIVTDSIDSAILIATSLDEMIVNSTKVSYNDLDNFETRRAALLLASKNGSIEITNSLKNYIIIWSNGATYSKKVDNKPSTKPLNYYQSILASFEILDKGFYEKVKKLITNPRCKGLINCCENTIIGFWNVHSLYLTYILKDGISLRSISYLDARLSSLYKDDILSSFLNAQKLDSIYYENKAFIESEILKKINSKNTKNLVSSVLDLLFINNLKALINSNYKITAKNNNLSCKVLGMEKLDIKDKSLAYALEETLEKSNSFKVISKKEERKDKRQLNKLSLLLLVYEKYGYSYIKTMRILDALYKSGFITCPHTNETRITSRMPEDDLYIIKENLEKDLEQKLGFTFQKVSIAPGDTLPIIPTKKIYTKEQVNTLNLFLLGKLGLEDPDAVFNIYFLVVQRFLDLFKEDKLETIYVLENQEGIRIEQKVDNAFQKLDILNIGDVCELEFNIQKVDLILEAIAMLSPLFSCSLKIENIKNDVVQGIIGILNMLDTETNIDSASPLLDIAKLNEYYSSLLFSEAEEFKMLEKEGKKEYLFETIGMLKI